MRKHSNYTIVSEQDIKGSLEKLTLTLLQHSNMSYNDNQDSSNCINNNTHYNTSLNDSNIDKSPNNTDKEFTSDQVAFLTNNGIDLNLAKQHLQSIAPENKIISINILLSCALEYYYMPTKALIYTFFALGANPNYINFFNETLLHLVLEKYKLSYNDEIAESKEYVYLTKLTSWLIDLGTNPDLKNVKGKSAKDIAKENNLHFVWAPRKKETTTKPVTSSSNNHALKNEFN